MSLKVAKQPKNHKSICMYTNTIIISIHIYLYGCFQKWWYPTTMGFPTKNDNFGVFWGYHHLRKHQYIYIHDIVMHQINGDAAVWK